MPFYAHDNLQCYAYNLLEEQFDNLVSDKDTQALEEFMTHLHTTTTLRDFIDQYLSDFESMNMMLQTAMLNTIDWEVLLKDIREYVADNDEYNNLMKPEYEYPYDESHKWDAYVSRIESQMMADKNNAIMSDV